MDCCGRARSASSHHVIGAGLASTEPFSCGIRERLGVAIIARSWLHCSRVCVCNALQKQKRREEKKKCLLLDEQLKCLGELAWLVALIVFTSFSLLFFCYCFFFFFFLLVNVSYHKCFCFLLLFYLSRMAWRVVSPITSEGSVFLGQLNV